MRAAKRSIDNAGQLLQLIVFDLGIDIHGDFAVLVASQILDRFGINTRVDQVRLPQSLPFAFDQSGLVFQFTQKLDGLLTKAEGFQMLADYNRNPFDVSASKTTFQEVYEKWSASKYVATKCSSC